MSGPNPAYDPENIFAKIIDGKIPSSKIFETDDVLAILDAFPMAPGHSLLMPKEKGYITIMDMPADKAAALLKELPKLSAMVMKATGAEGCNVVQNNLPAAGQVVPHVHFHVLPRIEGDGLCQLGKSGAMIEKDAAEMMIAKMTAE
jgi:diadenosine tetraphosphate (Ap4A) HIT family hydrolase